MNNTNSFAKGYSFLKYFWVFVIVCIIGYIYESVLSVFQSGAFCSRQGLLLGPFIPVYGLGAIMLMATLSKIKNWKMAFLVSAIVGGTVEFLYSFIQEKLFGTVSWTYYEYFMNFQGRTSIIHAIFWGILGIVFMKWIYPYLSNLIEKIPNKFGIGFSYLLVTFMALNIFLTIVVSLRQQKRIDNVPPQNVLDQFCDTYYPNERLDQIYSNQVRT